MFNSSSAMVGRYACGPIVTATPWLLEPKEKRKCAAPRPFKPKDSEMTILHINKDLGQPSAGAAKTLDLR
jgi:hypothetical protein